MLGLLKFMDRQSKHNSGQYNEESMTTTTLRWIWNLIGTFECTSMFRLLVLERVSLILLRDSMVI